MFRFACSCVLVLAFFPAAAAKADQISVPTTFTQAVIAQSSSTANAAPARQAVVTEAPPLMTTRVVSEQKRPSSLIPMYASFAALQGLDYHSTTKALSSGVGQEANPVMGAVVGNKGAFLALKAASTAGVVLVGEKLWKKNRAGAIVFMAIANGVMASVVAHNYSVVK
jgi:hypothetical protein